VHIIVKATLPPAGRKNDKIEMYESGRFFTVTGEHIGGTPSTIAARQTELTALHARIFGAKEHAKQTNANGKAHTVSDEEILTLARRAKNSDLFTRLFCGDWTGYPSQSEADQALCNLLVFWSGNDPVRIDRLFRQSGLYRKKWDEKHFSGGKTYGEATIETALAGAHEFYKRRKNGPDTASTKTQQEDSFSFTDAGNAERLVRRHGADLRYCHVWKKWLTWNGTRWQEDTTGAVMRYAKATARAIATEETAGVKDDKQFAQLLAWSKASLSQARLKAMIDLAQSEPGIPIQPDDLDKDPWLLNCSNGTLDLKTGALRPHQQRDLLTKSTGIPYDPCATCPMWEAFLERVFDGKQELMSWVWKAIGYSLTGLTTEQCFFLCHGIGSNGKSTFLNMLRSLTGEYGEQATFETFLRQDRESVRNDLATLKGCRFVAALEMDQGRQLAESLVKALTGGDALTVRFLFSEFFTYTPQFKVWLAANHKPEIRGTDHAMWRRVRLIPFDVVIPENQQDKTLSEKLRGELPGILTWAVRGCLAWQEEGLEPPEAVKTATQAYKEESDRLSSFLAECCIVQPDLRTPAGNLFAAYQEWLKTNGEKDGLNQTQFGRALNERGFQKDNDEVTRRVVRHGLGLRVSETV
jgi:putative DNA primase/helicase